MSKKQKNVKMNKRLLNMNMEKKVATSFKSIRVGYIIMLVLALANILIYAKLANISIFSLTNIRIRIIFKIWCSERFRTAEISFLSEI